MYKRPMFVWFGLCCIFEMYSLNRTSIPAVLISALIISTAGHLPEIKNSLWGLRRRNISRHRQGGRMTALPDTKKLKYCITDILICFSILFFLGLKTVSLNLKDHEFPNKEFTGRITDINKGGGYCQYTVKTGRYKLLVTGSVRNDKKEEYQFDIGQEVYFSGNYKPFEKPEVFGQFDEYTYYVRLKGYDGRFYADEAKLVGGEGKNVSGEEGSRGGVGKNVSGEKGTRGGVERNVSGEEGTRGGEERNVSGEEGTRGGEGRLRIRLLETFRESLYTYFDDEDAGVVAAMTLGDKSLMSDDLKKIYKDNGLLHLTVVSGTHITLLGMAFFELLKKRRGVRSASAVSMFAVIFYVYITGFNPSSNRAVIMMLILFGAKLVRRAYDMPSALGLAGIIVLMDNPLSIMGSGFRLSFMAVFAICFIYKPLTSSLNIKQDANEIILSDKDKMKKRLLSFFWSPLLLSLSINLITLPVILDSYYEYPVYSALANCLIMPFIPLILILSMFVMCLGAVSALVNLAAPAGFSVMKAPAYVAAMKAPAGFSVMKAPAYVAAGITSSLLKAQYWILDRTAALPFGKLVTGKPQSASVIIYYLFVAAVIFVLPRLIRWLNPVRRKKLITAVVLWSMIILGCFVLKRKNEKGFTMLNVGQGLCMVMNSGNEILMFDAGSTSINSVGKKRIIPYLKASGISEIEYLFISHFDEDHINAVSEMEDDPDITISKIICPPDTDETQLEKAEIKGRDEIYSIHEFETVTGTGYSIVCLNPSRDNCDPDANESSVCLYVEFNGKSALITGDVAGEGEVNLKKNLDKLGIHVLDILVVAHHGSRYSTTEEFLKGLDVKEAWISCGKNNIYGHPAPETLERLQARGIRIYRTDRIIK